MTASRVVGLVLALQFYQALSRGEQVVREFPFEYCDGLIFVQEQVQVGKSTVHLNLLLDSGAGLNVINLPTLARVGTLGGRRMTVRGVGATTVGYWPQHLALMGNGLPVSDYFLAVDLSEFGKACDKTVDGLIGVDFFLNHVVEIDFDARTIRLLDSSEGLGGQKQLPLRLRGRALQVPIRVNDNTAEWARLDTGCAAALHWVNAKLRPDEGTPSLSVALTTLPVKTLPTRVQLGTVQMDDVPTNVHRKQIFAGESGLLGNGLLSRFGSITIDVKAGRLVLGKPTPVRTLQETAAD